MKGRINEYGQIQCDHSLKSLFRFSNYSFRPSLLLPRLVKKRSFFHTVEVCWKRETGSLFFFFVAGDFNLNVYAAATYFWESLFSELTFLRKTADDLTGTVGCCLAGLSLGFR